jgi:hypothetical protein
MRHIKTIVILLICTLLFSCNQQDKIKSVADIYSKLEQEPQTFKINPSKENILKCKQGTKILIPSNAFQIPKGLNPDSITLDVKEFYNSGSMITENLSTSSDNRILETGGMLHIDAKYKNERLSLTKGKRFTISMPSDSKKRNMMLFKGTRDSIGKIDWKIDKEGSKINNAKALNKIKREYHYIASLARWSYINKDGKEIPLATHPLIGSKFTLEEYIVKEQFLSQSDFKKIHDIKGDKIEIVFNINSAGDFYKLRVNNCTDEKIEKAVFNFFDNFPLLDIEKTGLDYSGYANWSIVFRTKYVIDKEKYEREFNNKYSKYRQTAIEKMDLNELNTYIFSVSILGWINCDRFLDYDKEKIDFFIATENPENADIKLIFTDINSILKGENYNGQIIFRNVPLNENVKVLGLNVINEKPVMAVKNTVINKELFNLSDYNKFTISELENEMKGLKN